MKAACIQKAYFGKRDNNGKTDDTDESDLNGFAERDNNGKIASVLNLQYC